MKDGVHSLEGKSVELWNSVEYERSECRREDRQFDSDCTPKEKRMKLRKVEFF